MLNFNSFKELLKKGIDTNQYLLLYFLGQGVDLKDILDQIKVGGMIIALEKKELIKKIKNGIYEITKNGEEILHSVSGDTEEVAQNTKYKIDGLKKTLEAKMLELTGTKNKIIYNKYFIPAQKVLERRLIDASKIFDFEIDEKVEKVLLQHIERSVKSRFDKVRTIEYFILGQYSKSSDLASALDNFEDEEISHSSINIEI